MVKRTSNLGEADKLINSKRQVFAVAAGAMTVVGSFSIAAGPAQAHHKNRPCSRHYAHRACVPRGRNDVDCDQIRATDFRVKGQDIYGLDGDGDNVACES